MAGTIDKRLNELGIELPPANAPAGNYVPFVRTGNLLFISGQIPMVDGKPGFIGTLGAALTVDDGAAAARACGLSILAQVREALDGDLDRVVRCVKLSGFVASTPDFGDQPKVVNGASDLMVDVFGEAGRHARAAVGMASLPLGVAVEVEAIFEVS
ncbi:MAG: RidA family protein [Alphaproteobacteria bacterium]|nr:RidA family protein [Alphaproteobacteria bacterium]